MTELSLQLITVKASWPWRQWKLDWSSGVNPANGTTPLAGVSTGGPDQWITTNQPASHRGDRPIYPSKLTINPAIRNQIPTIQNLNQTTL